MSSDFVLSFSTWISAVLSTKFWQYVPTVASMESKSVAKFPFDGEKQVW